ncbi:MAG TPA: hypothetical protein VLA46_04730 [Saprospiraceae bacterium]|nr:hypothetical protein [Saprospiraceae bacterium]
MRSHFNLVAVFSLFVIAAFFTACQKDDNLSNSEGLLSTRDSHNFTYSINPAMVGDSIVITFDLENDADCGLAMIQVSGPDGNGWSNGGKPVTPDSGIATLLFIPDAPGEYRVRGKYTRTGNPKSCDFESTGWMESADLLIVEGDTTGMEDDSTEMEDDSTSCEISFTGEAISCDSVREVVFTYTPDQDYNHIKIQGGLTNGTLEDAVVTVDGADLDVKQRTPGNSSNRIITIEGSVEACVPITITITWSSSNQGDVITGDWSATGADDVEGLECE